MIKYSMARVKICGITNKEDAFAAIDFGADALGFVCYAGSPRAVDSDTAKDIISTLPPFVTTVGVFVDDDKKNLERTASYVGLDAIQLHGSESPEYCSSIDNKKIIKAIKVKYLSDLDVLKNYTSVSAFLLDTYSPDQHGGTGQKFNWDIAVEAKKFGRIILAGGLNHDNIENAIELVRPYGVDVSSGVEGNIKGKKDPAKLKLFIERAKKVSMKYE